jgi:lipoyl-dependent peroxiredoxin
LFTADAYRRSVPDRARAEDRGVDVVIAALPTIAERTARTIWTGGLLTGRGRITSGSGVLGGLPVTWASRVQQPDGKTSPEELAAVAHASCFSMALALRLGEHDLTPQRLDVTATLSLVDVDGRPTIVSSVLRVVAQVMDVDGDTFKTIVDEAAALCPISRLFAGAEITVDAFLDAT